MPYPTNKVEYVKQVLKMSDIDILPYPTNKLHYIMSTNQFINFIPKVKIINLTEFFDEICLECLHIDSGNVSYTAVPRSCIHLISVSILSQK